MRSNTRRVWLITAQWVDYTEIVGVATNIDDARWIAEEHVRTGPWGQAEVKWEEPVETHLHEGTFTGMYPEETKIVQRGIVPIEPGERIYFLSRLPVTRKPAEVLDSPVETD